jgi:phosphomannomutase/phosphoglucomutase
MLELLSKSDRTLSEMVDELPRYFSTPEIRLTCNSDTEKFEIAQKAAEYFKAHYDCIDVDGVRVRFGDGWGLVRASNTQPVLVVRFEAKTAARMEAIQTLVMNKIAEFGEVHLDEGH